jgi:hypothetical protein
MLIHGCSYSNRNFIINFFKEKNICLRNVSVNEIMAKENFYFRDIIREETNNFELIIVDCEKQLSFSLFNSILQNLHQNSIYKNIPCIFCFEIKWMLTRLAKKMENNFIIINLENEFLYDLNEKTIRQNDIENDQNPKPNYCSVV